LWPPIPEVAMIPERREAQRIAQMMTIPVWFSVFIGAC
jgi:hypothetical protein